MVSKSIYLFISYYHTLIEYCVEDTRNFTLSCSHHTHCMSHVACHSEEPLGKGEQQIQRNLIEILFSLILSQHLERLYPTQIGINTHTHTHTSGSSLRPPKYYPLFLPSPYAFNPPKPNTLRRKVAAFMRVCVAAQGRLQETVELTAGSERDREKRERESKRK